MRCILAIVSNLNARCRDQTGSKEQVSERHASAELKRSWTAGTKYLLDAVCRLAEGPGLRQVAAESRQIGHVEHIEPLHEQRQAIPLTKAECLAKPHILRAESVAERVALRQTELRNQLAARGPAEGEAAVELGDEGGERTRAETPIELVVAAPRQNIAVGSIAVEIDGAHHRGERRLTRNRRDRRQPDAPWQIEDARRAQRVAAIAIQRTVALEPVLLVDDAVPPGVVRKRVRHQELRSTRVALVELHQQAAIVRASTRGVHANRTGRTRGVRIQQLRNVAFRNDRAA